MQKSLYLITLCLLLASCSSDIPEYPHLLLISIDTLRADHLGAYGHSGLHTPTLDRLAREGITFCDMFAQCPTTVPSHATIFSSLYPFTHGCRANVAFDFKRHKDQFLAVNLKNAGYTTAAFTSLAQFTGAFGMSLGFDVHNDPSPKVPGLPLPKERPAAETTDKAIRWLSRLPMTKSFFLWVHYYDPHAPYQPPKPYDQLYPTPEEIYPQQNINVHLISEQALELPHTDPRRYEGHYAGEVAYVDRQVGRLLTTLQMRRILEDTIVVVLSDHGESLGEGDFYYAHTWRLNEVSLHIPFLVYNPKLKDFKPIVERTVRSLDILPTVMELLELPVPEKSQGVSLLPEITGEFRDQEFPIYAETGATEVKPEHKIRSFRRDEWKVIYAPEPSKFYWTAGPYRFYNLESDPQELDDLIEVKSHEFGRMKRMLLGFTNRYGASESGDLPQVDEETRRLLESLGYLGDFGAKQVKKPQSFKIKKLQIVASDLNTPVLIAPDHNAVLWELPRFEWSLLPKATGYHFYYNYTGFDAGWLTVGTTKPNLDSYLDWQRWRELPQGMYYWRVAAVNEGGVESAYTPQRTFQKVAALELPVPDRFPWTIEAEDLPSHTGVVERYSFASGYKARVGRSGSGSGLMAPQYLCFGPEAVLPKGRYSLTAYLRGVSLHPESVSGYLDVAFNRGEQVLGQRAIRISDWDLNLIWTPVELEFEVLEKDKADFRIWYTGVGELVVDRFVVNQHEEYLSPLLEKFERKYKNRY